MKEKRLNNFKTLFFPFMCIILLFVGIISASAASLVVQPSGSPVLPEGYHFAPRYISGTTTYQLCSAPSGYKWNIGTSELTMHNSAGKEAVPPASSKGNIWIRYNKVGVYNNQWVDMKVTMTNWSSPKRIGFGKTSIAVLNPSGSSGGTSKYIDVKIEYFKSGTNTLYSGLKGHSIIGDMDYFKGTKAGE